MTQNSLIIKPTKNEIDSEAYNCYENIELIAILSHFRISKLCIVFFLLNNLIRKENWSNLVYFRNVRGQSVSQNNGQTLTFFSELKICMLEFIEKHEKR